MDVEKRPVVSGLVALVAVAVVVGLVAGFAALAGARMLGLDGDAVASGGGDRPTSGETLYLPKPTDTERPSDPLVTLLPADEGEDEGKGKGRRKGEASEREDPDKQGDKKQKEVISLSASQLQVSPMERIDLTGTYPGGEGAVLQVQRLEGGTWSDFPVTVTVSNQTFSTYVQTGQAGPNKFRVVDTDTGKASNPVTVRVG